MGWRHIGHLGVARENRMLVESIACRCAIGLTRLKSDDYTCRTVRKWLVDAGSIPASSTIHGGQTNSVPLFFSCCAPVLARFLARVRRTPLTRTAPFWAAFRSQFPPILCFCDGRRRVQTSDDAGFRLLVRHGSRRRAGDSMQTSGQTLGMRL